MQFQLRRYEYVKSIEFKNSNPLLNVERIRYFKEDGLTGTFTSKEFKYSWDNVTWTNWNTLTQQAVANIQFRDNLNFWIHIRYSRNGIGNGDIKRSYIFYDSTTPTPPGPVDASIDADYLQGEGPKYYLDRTNHFGPYTDLVVSNVVDGSAVGVYYGRTDSSLGTELFFKRLEGIGGISVSESSSGIITIDGSGASGSGSTYQNPNPTTNSFGSIPDASTFFASEKTFADVMQAMFFPTLYPSLTNPSNTFVDNVANLQEINNSINITFTSSFNRGGINPAYGTSGFRSGSGNTVYYTGSGLPGSIGSYPLNPNTQTVSGYIVLIGNQSWTSAWSYDSGEQPKDSGGNNYNSPLPAGTTSYRSTSFEGVYALYGTTSTINNPNTKQSLVSMLTGNNIIFSMTAESGGYKQSFDIPNAWTGAPTNRPLLNIQTFNTVSGQWETTGLGQWTLSSTTHEGVNYTRYTFNGPDRSSIQIRLVF